MYDRRLGRLGAATSNAGLHLGLRARAAGATATSSCTPFRRCAGGVAPILSMGAASARPGAVPWPPSWSAPAGRPPQTSPSAGIRSRRGDHAPKRSSAWPPSRAGSGTGPPPPTGRSAPTAVPPTSAPWPASPSTRPSSASRPPPTGGATGWWRPTAASSASATPPSTAPPGHLLLNKPIVGMTATARRGRATGWWRPTAASSVSATPATTAPWAPRPSTEPIVGMSVDPATGGYWLVAADGGIFSFDAPFFGSTGALRLNKPIVGMEALANGRATASWLLTAGSSASAGRLRRLGRGPGPHRPRWHGPRPSDQGLLAGGASGVRLQFRRRLLWKPSVTLNTIDDVAQEAAGGV